MKHYQELTILPDPEINMYFIWQKLYTQLHIALADLANQHGIKTVGVTFPNYKYEDSNGKEFAHLGNKLRLFAINESDLKTLDINKWLERLTDYIHIRSIQAVPDNTEGYLLVSRYRYQSLDKQAKDFAEFKNISFEDSLAHCKQYKQASRKNYPFINLKSVETGQIFKLSIRQEMVDTAVTGEFNTYGINTNGGQVTVPHW